MLVAALVLAVACAVAALGWALSLRAALQRRTAALDAAERRAAAATDRARVLEEERTLEEQEQERRAPTAPGAGAGTELPTWRLLLARIERQWAAAVGAGPDERGAVPGPQVEQLVQALHRELERLKEEVGLHTDAVVVGSPAEGLDSVGALLVTTEALATLAPHVERLSVDLDDRVVVVGESWTGPAADLEGLRSATAGTGLVCTVDAGDGDVRVMLEPSPRA